MGLTDVFKTKQFKSDIKELQNENEYLKSLLTPEMKEALSIKQRIDILNLERDKLLTVIETHKKEIENKHQQIQSLDRNIQEKKQNIIFLDDEALYQSFSLYTPMYNLKNSEAYKDKLGVVRAQQKAMIKNNTAVHFPTNFSYNNSLSQGKKVVDDNVKQILRSFNNECEAIIDKVKFNNVESIRKRILKSYDDLNKLNDKMKISIDATYLELKFQEMNLCYEYAMKKQEEKEEARRIREEQREAQKLQREIDEARRTSEKEKKHYTNALNKLLSQIESATEIEKTLLLEKKKELEQKLQTIDKEIEQIDYREANQRAGYVYIISNIGSFGENIYKIGMTRRLEPMDRVDELGDASVPFKFDVHAMIFSDDAPALETALHRAFDKQKCNMINSRREFFHVTLEEIERVIRANYDKTIEFVKIPAAEQFRESQMLRKHANQSEFVHKVPHIETNHTKIQQNNINYKSNSNIKYIYTKWGKYKAPVPYKTYLKKSLPPDAIVE